MLFKENKIEQPSKRENILKRLASSPTLKRVILVALLSIGFPSDLNKKNITAEKARDSIENSKSMEGMSSQDTTALEDSSDIPANEILNESLSEEEYKVNTATNYPMYKGERFNNNQKVKK